MIRPVIIFGVEYCSLKDLQQAYPYLSGPTLSKRIRRGLTDAEIVAPPTKSPIALTIDGAYYPSVAAASRDTNVPYPTYLYRTKRAMNAEPGTQISLRKAYKPRKDRSRDTRRKTIVIEGVCYGSYTEAAAATGINYQTLISRIKNGWYAHDNGELIRPPKKKTREPNYGHVVTYKGVTYKSISALARDYNMRPDLVRNRILSGWSIEGALTPPTCIEYCGEKYKNKTAIAKTYGVDVRRFLYLLDCGLDISAALDGARDVKKRQENELTEIKTSLDVELEVTEIIL